YAFGNQPTIAQWNLVCLAEALLPLFAEDEALAVRLANERLERFPALFEREYGAVFRAKLGLAREEDGDRALIDDLLQRLAQHGVDYTVFFRGLCAAAADAGAAASLAALFPDPAVLSSWLRAWQQRLAREERSRAASGDAMRQANPAFIPRN